MKIKLLGGPGAHVALQGILPQDASDTIRSLKLQKLRDDNSQREKSKLGAADPGGRRYLAHPSSCPVVGPCKSQLT